MDEINPNFAELAKEWGCDYRTVKKYFHQDESKPPISKQMNYFSSVMLVILK